MFFTSTVNSKVTSVRSVNLTWAGVDHLSGYLVFPAHTVASKWQLPFLIQRKEKCKYVPDQISNAGPLAIESDALPTAPRDPTHKVK